MFIVGWNAEDFVQKELDFAIRREKVGQTTVFVISCQSVSIEMLY